MNTTPLEIHEQIAVIQYLELLQVQGKVLLFSAVPNNTFTKSWAQKIKQRKEGVRQGVPDILIVTPEKVLFLEMKRLMGGTVSPEQKLWNHHTNHKKTISAICKGFNEAKEFIDGEL